MVKTPNYFDKLSRLISLEGEVDNYDEIDQNIIKGISFRGTNLWILVFAIIIASVGLNMNSTAVIIGAMLISPLMGPINGMGYSLATFNFPLFKRALKNFMFAVLASLGASTIYFAVTPITVAHSELLARTSPTIYDVLIALFGGLAGIVAISSRNKGNVIPGVAIATALMPPLCTAGYGLASANWTYFFGALYLFIINTVFIALASVITSQILKFPIRQQIDDDQKKRINRMLTAVCILILLPSIYFGYLLVVKEEFNEKANRFVSEVGVVEGTYLLKNQINADRKKITLVYGGASLSASQKKSINETARQLGLKDAEIIFQQGLSFETLSTKTTEVEKLQGELNMLQSVLQAKERHADSLVSEKMKGRQILNEIRAIYPAINSCAYSDTYNFQDTIQEPRNLAVLIFTARANQLNSSDKGKIDRWVKSRLASDSVKVFFEER